MRVGRPRAHIAAFVIPTLSLLGAAPLAAQAPVHGTDINAAADSGRQRSPVLFGTAYTVAAGARGISFQQAWATDMTRRTYVFGLDGRSTYYRDQLASTVSAYWGVRDWLTLGGSVGFATTSTQSYWSDGTFASPADQSAYRVHRTIGDLRASARARLFRSAGGGTQLAANLAIGVRPITASYGTAVVDGSIGLALAQQIGPVSLHLAPSLQSDRGDAYGQIAGGIVFPILPRVTASVEGIATSSTSGVYWMPGRPAMFDVGGGLRFDLGRLDLDVGLRQSTYGTSGPFGAGRMRAVIGTHVQF